LIAASKSGGVLEAICWRAAADAVCAAENSGGIGTGGSGVPVGGLRPAPGRGKRTLARSYDVSNVWIARLLEGREATAPIDEAMLAYPNRLQRLGLVGPSVTGKDTAESVASVTETPHDRESESGASVSDPWAWVELNYRPHAYQACALTT
jgi:hypothetical protein